MKTKKYLMNGLFSFILCFPLTIIAQTQEKPFSVKENYLKKEIFITMRDGIKLFTAIYIPIDSSESYPLLMVRTPYSISPYGVDKFRNSLGPNGAMAKEKYIFVYQDVRGRYKSEGQFEEVTPAVANKKSKKDVDESSDTYDTIDWLLKNTKNNGNVGLYGISYPGFFATASLPDAHPAIKAVSPQAPVTDEFIGDDCNHNGAFFLLDNFGFYNYFEGAKNENGESYSGIFNARYNDAYKFFLEMGPLKNSNGPLYYNNKGKIYSEILQNDTYNNYWKSRNIRTHLKNIKPAVLVVGGWFDAEDLFGALQTYASIEKQSPGNNNRIVMGPWTHGGWAGASWTSYASHDFSANLNDYYHAQIEIPFFNYYLKGKGKFEAAEATIFETGSNQWKNYAVWPPANVTATPFYFNDKGKLSQQKTSAANSYSEYVSDPAKPVPYTGIISARRNNEYMAEDQRFAAQRPDVLVFETDTLMEDLNLTGKIMANLFVSMTGTDADFIVKLIDVLPESEKNPNPNPKNYQLAGAQRLVRAEVFRGKFRNSYEKPQAFVPGKVEQVSFSLNEVAHVFKKGHRIMVQVQSSWFPLVDRNPQKFMRIPEAEDKDYQKSTIRIYHTSNIILPVLK
jgi:putative CocE/NonD family hydrolase